MLLHRPRSCLARSAPVNSRGAPGAARPAAARRRGATAAAAAQEPAPAAAPGAAPGAGLDMAERMAFLREDLAHLFDDQGVDASQYEDVVTFLDPITKYDSVQGYMFNIRMLKSVFSPVFELHDIRQTGPAEATTRWTMTMKFTPAAALGLSRWWDPVITFTGTSTYGFNPATRRINRHIDTWDSIANQDFFSTEAFADFFRQLLATRRTPPLAGPRYTLLRRAPSFEVRRYEPFVIAATPLDNLGAPAPPDEPGGAAEGAGSGAGARRVNPASAGMRAFNALAGYLFGKNAAGAKMAMTTPVLSDTAGNMAFVVDAAPQAPPAALPAPLDPAVQLAAAPGGLWAAAVFGGVATPRAAAKAAAALLADLEAAGLRPVDPGLWSLARYNDPSVKPRFRRNEVLVQLASFDLWA
ncbi:heme-binding-like protein [Scenedesmus sp. PABB004]|nr:heme-binding-like protein [Scenedesmus sp. PABB004]